jgi:diguanylate cyclase (GGDEF)-like protein/PAS domain S-box-containing protein
MPKHGYSQKQLINRQRTLQITSLTVLAVPVVLTLVFAHEAFDRKVADELHMNSIWHDFAPSLLLLSVISLLLLWLAIRARLKLLKAESELLDANESLETTVLARTVALTHANKALEQQIADRNQAEAEMLKLSMALSQTDDIVMITNQFGIIEYVNQAFIRTTGFSREESLGFTPAFLKSGQQSATFYRMMWQVLAEGRVFRDVMINRRKNGELYYEEKTITPLKDESGVITHFVSTGKDITDRTRMQERLTYLSNHDGLTQLPNRNMFLDRLEHTLNSARFLNSSFSVLFVDLDHFKDIVDTLGHEAGDKLLEEIARRLQGCMHEADTLARLGGDEFGFILSHVQDPNEAAEKCCEILQHIAVPFLINEREVQLTASIGVTVYPTDGQDCATLTKNADIAMYRAKELGRNCYQFFTAELTMRALARMEIDHKLRHALERKEFSLHYQPKINLADDRVYGLEALLRWDNAELGRIGPDQFIPVLESNGLILSVGDWVLQEACQFLQKLHLEGCKVSMAVNLSARQLISGGLAEKIEQLLIHLNIEPSYLELEITESMLIENMEPAVELLRRLKNYGVRVSVDDFGTGYSSLGYLKRLPIDTLKIDRSFVRDLTANTEDAAITSAIIALAHSLDLDVVAEGIETGDQDRLLKNLGCELGQGYLYSRPLDENAILHWLKLHCKIAELASPSHFNGPVVVSETEQAAIRGISA